VISLSSLLSVAHLVGLALGVGSATVKLVLVLKCHADHAFVPVYIKVARLITRQIVLGVVLLTLSGIGWLLLGYQFTPLLIVKVVLVAAIWVLGLFIDNVVEPRFQKMAPGPGEPVSPAFIRIQKQHLTLEVIATLLFYLIIVIWVRG
jgi:tetrahydromethanopterin S-methyltransferase subunit D